MKENLTIGFIGNPNCGKTTLFNAYTGANLKVANWPGVTVEKVEGAIRDHNLNIRLVDLPGTYSLTSYTMEEQVSRQFILSDEVDMIIDVVDASALERNLYLTLQLLELGKPVVMALNMMDIVEKRGMEIDTHRLPEMLGIPVIPVSARKRTGLDVLLHAAAHHKDCNDPQCLVHHHKDQSRHRHNHHAEYAMVYSDKIEDKIDLIMDALKINYPKLKNYRWYAIKLLEMDREITKSYPVHLPDVIDRSYESDIINEKYDFIQEIIREVLVNKDRQDALTEKADKVLTHRVWGVPIFLGIMAVVFLLTFTVGDWLKGYLEIGIENLSLWIEKGLVAAQVNEVIRSLIVDGILAGVGGILTFLPNIFILFLALAFLEDSGYMARVAYVMEGIMSKLGLSGRAFIPMILGFGCTVPAIMASRALESRRDRFKVMLITPFMSCSARLPIYILFAEMFFKERAMLVAYSMYLIGLVVAILVAAIIHLIDKKKSENYLLIELPEYKIPSSRTVAIYVWEKVKDYLTKAGTTIFIASILMWIILNFGPHGYTTDMSDSFGAILGHGLVPFFAPIGLGFWQIAVALIAGISAKEVVVSSCAVLFGVSNINSGAGMDTLEGILGSAGFGQLNAFCLMIFCLLYIPCMAALATIRKESGSTRWMLLSGWFSHIVKYLVGNVFRRDTKLSADMILHKFLQKNRTLVRYHIVKADSRTDKNLFDSGDLAEFPKKCHVIGMVYGKVSARFREKTLPVLADTFGELLLTGWLPEVCGRASDIMDIALEIRIMSHFFCFFENGLMASRLENASLMERQSTEITTAETAPVARQAEFDLLQSRDPASGVIHRMPGILIGKVVNIVHLLLAQWKCRRVLDHVSSISVALCHRSGSKRVGISVLLGKAFGIGFFVRRYCLIGRKDDRIISARQIFALINSSRNESDLIYRKAALQRLRNLDD